MTEADEAKAKAIQCRSAWWGYLPCQLGGGCPFGRLPPQRPSELRSMCKDVTAEMWESFFKKEAGHGDA